MKKTLKDLEEKTKKLADDADEFHCETEVIRVRPKNPSFNINSKYLKYIDNLSTACVDIPVSQNLRFMIQLNKK